MAELFVFTLLATIVAIYGVLPRYRQLRVGYSLGNKRSIAVLSFFGLIIIAGYVGGLVLQHNDRTSLGTLDTGYFLVEFTPLMVELVQLVVVLAIVGVLLGVFVRNTVRIRNESLLLSTMRDLDNKEEYGTLVDLIRDNYVPLIDHPEKPTVPGNEPLAEFIAAFDVVDEEDVEEEDDPGLAIQFVEEVEERAPERWIERAREKASLKRRQLRYRVELLRYRLEETAEDANGYTERLLLDPEFGTEHPVLDPDLGIDIISDDSLDGFRRRDFVHQYLTTLLRTENSLLYRDISHNMSKDGLYRYRIDSENRLLHALLSDCSRVEELDAYKPIGDTAQDIIREQGSKDYDKYNARQLTTSDRSEDYIFADPLFVAITYFDIMVSESFFQRMEWHMWLYYYDSITRLICKNYEITEESDPSAEWPNDYSRILYEMMSNMRDWLMAMETMVLEDEYDVTKDSDEDQEEAGDEEDGGEDADEQYTDFIQLDSMDTHRGANIPKSTVICLFSCHKQILTTPEIPDQFKAYLTEQVFVTCIDLRKHDEGSLPWQYSELMLHCLKENLDDRRSGYVYHRALRDVYEDGVRHEVIAKAVTGESIVDELDDLVL